MRKAFALFVGILLAALVCRADLTEKIVLYQGDEWEAQEAITFDGEQFSAPGRPAIPRDEVKEVEFRARDARERSASESTDAEALSPLAEQYLEKGRQMAGAFPGVGGVILVDDGMFEYHKDGTHAYRYHFAGLVLKEDMKGWSQITLGFTEGRSRAALVYGRSVSPDGVVQSLDPATLKEGSPSEDMQFFNPNRKVLSGVIPGVEVGSVVEYAYEYEYYNPEDPRLFSPGYLFQGTEPVVFSRVEVIIPGDVPFHYTTRNFEDPALAEPKVEEKNGTRFYTWQVEDMPPVIPEPMMPPTHDVVPLMEASIFADYEEVYELLGGLQENRIRVTPEIGAAVEEIVKGAETVDEKIARIYYWVQENTRYISIKGSLGAGFSGHTAQETFQNRYGDCTDKAILFATMLKAVGVESYPLIVKTNDAGEAIVDIPTLQGNHCISEVCLPDRSFYLDSTAQNYRYPYFRADDHGIYALNAIRGDIKRIPVPPPEDNRRLSRLDVTLDAQGDAEVRTRNEYNGNIEAGVRGFWKRTREDNRKLMMAQYVNSISPGAELEDFTLSDLDDLSQQLTMSIDYRLAGHAVRAKDLMYFRMPTLEREYPETALETRQYPINYHTTEERILEIDVALPPGFRAKWFAPALDIENPYLEFHAAYEEADGHIRFTETFRRLERVIPPEDYGAYRDALQAIAAFSKQEVFLMDEGR